MTGATWPGIPDGAEMIPQPLFRAVLLGAAINKEKNAKK